MVGGADPTIASTSAILVTGNWLDMDEVIRLAYLRKEYKRSLVNIDFEEYKGNIYHKTVYFLLHISHYFVFARLRDNTIYLSEGSNSSENNHEVQEELKALLKEDFVYLKNNAQTKVNHCASSAIFIDHGLGDNIHKNNWTELKVNIPLRDRIIRQLHKQKDFKIAVSKIPPPMSLECRHCGLKRRNPTKLKQHEAKCDNKAQQ